MTGPFNLSGNAWPFARLAMASFYVYGLISQFDNLSHYNTSFISLKGLLHACNFPYVLMFSNNPIQIFCHSKTLILHFYWCIWINMIQVFSWFLHCTWKRLQISIMLVALHTLIKNILSCEYNKIVSAICLFCRRCRFVFKFLIFCIALDVIFHEKKNTVTSDLNWIFYCIFLLEVFKSKENSILPKCQIRPCCIHLTICFSNRMY